MINIYINVAVLNNVNEVLEKILDRIDLSGLYEKSNEIYLVINGDLNQIKVNLDKEKYKIINYNKDISKCEFPTLDLIWEHSQLDKDLNLLYLHTKGVTNPNQESIKSWTEYLSYFNIDMWKQRIIELEEFDCTGVDLKGNPDDIKSSPSLWGWGKAPLHYSGNFWWSKSTHVNKLPKPSDWLPDLNYSRWRMMAEMYICQNFDGKYNCVYNSNVNFYTSYFNTDSYKNKIIK
jgi:hypothetical protein